MEAILLSLFRSKFGAYTAAAVLMLCFVTIGYMTVDRAWIRADLAEARTSIALVKAGVDAFRVQSVAAADQLVRNNRERNIRLTKTESEIRNAPSTAVTDHDLAIRDCLLRLRAHGDCTFTEGAAPDPGTPPDN